MSFVIEPTQPVPLLAGSDGVIRMAGSGATAEEIVQQYPSLSLAEVYAVISYLLSHRAEVEAYLAGRARDRAAVQTEVEQRFDPTGIRSRLLARRPLPPKER